MPRKPPTLSRETRPTKFQTPKPKQVFLIWDFSLFWWLERFISRGVCILSCKIEACITNAKSINIYIYCIHIHLYVSGTYVEKTTHVPRSIYPRLQFSDSFACLLASTVKQKLTLVQPMCIKGKTLVAKQTPRQQEQRINHPPNDRGGRTYTLPQYHKPSPHHREGKSFTTTPHGGWGGPADAAPSIYIYIYICLGFAWKLNYRWENDDFSIQKKRKI